MHTQNICMTSSEKAKLQYRSGGLRRPPFIGSYIGVLISQMRSYKYVVYAYKYYFVCIQNSFVCIQIFCHFRLEYFDCLPFKIVSYELFRCGKMISEAVRIFYVLIIIKNGFLPPEANQGELGNVVIYIKNGFLPPEAHQGEPGNVCIFTQYLIPNT